MKSISKIWEKLKDVELVQIHEEEMKALYNHALEFDNVNIVEIGSAHGASSIVLAEAARAKNGTLFCFDPFLEDYYGQDKFGEYAYKQFLTNMQGYHDVLEFTRGTSSQYTQVTGKPIDILFIDGDHSYEAVDRDCCNLLGCMTYGGYVAFHDYNNVLFSGVKKAADEHTSRWITTDNVWDMIIRQRPIL